MKIISAIPTRTNWSPIRYAVSTLILSAVMTALASATLGVVVQTTNRRIEGGRVDFGNGTHTLGSPDGNGVITYDYAVDSNGFVVATARVRGTLYWDSYFSGGCARLTIRFRDFFANNLAIRQSEFCGPGGEANSTQNRLAVDHSFSHIDLWNVRITVQEVVSGVPVGGTSSTITAPEHRVFPLKINSGTADFGGSGHLFGSPQSDANLSFRRDRNSSIMSGFVNAVLYWDSLFSPGCARAIIDERNVLAAVFDSMTYEVCGPGGDAGNSENRLSVLHSAGNSYRQGLWQIRVRVGSLAGTSFVGVTDRLFGFNGPVGNFEVEPAEASVAAREPVSYAYTWTVPEGGNWHELRHLQFRITDGSESVIWVHWDEETNMFRLLNEASGRFGPGFAPGSPVPLQTKYASLDLTNTTVSAINSVLGSGPTSPSVLLNLGLSFKPLAAGRTYEIEVAAIDDAGNEDPFVRVGTLTVTP